MAMPVPDDIEVLALSPEEKARVHMTVGCHDCDGIPKVSDAGSVLDGPSGRYQVMHNGLKIVEHCYGGTWMTEIIRRLKGHHEPQEELVFHEVMKRISPGSTMMELGCFWSYYSLWFNHSVEGARLLLLEPVVENLEAGERNFSLNGVTGTFVRALAGAKSDTGTKMVGEDRVLHAVPTLSVDDFAARNQAERVDVLLVDVQGAELAVLHGARGLIERGALRFVFVSTHHHRISNDPLMHQRCVRFLEDRGAHIIAKHNVVESFSGDGLIVASFDPSDRDLVVPISKNWPTNGMWPELEYDLDEAWNSHGIGVALRRRLRDSAAHAAYRMPAVLPVLHGAVSRWDQLATKRQARRRP